MYSLRDLFKNLSYLHRISRHHHLLQSSLLYHLFRWLFPKFKFPVNLTKFFLFCLRNLLPNLSYLHQKSRHHLLQSSLLYNLFRWLFPTFKFRVKFSLEVPKYRELFCLRELLQNLTYHQQKSRHHLLQSSLFYYLFRWLFPTFKFPVKVSLEFVFLFRNLRL